MTARQPDLLATLEHGVIDRAVPTADLLRTCIVLGGRTGSARLSDWASSELRGYRDLNSIPVYRTVAIPILVTWEHHSRSARDPEIETVVLSKHKYSLHLGKPIDELDALAAQTERTGKPALLAVDTDILEKYSRKQSYYYHETGAGGQITDMQWLLESPVIRGILGQIRTALAEFTAELRTEVGDDDVLPSATQTDEALKVAVPGALFANSNVTIMTTGTGDIRAEGDQAVIKDNKTAIKDSSGNFAVANAKATQVSGPAFNGAKAREFADLILQISPTIGLASDQEIELRKIGNDLAHVAESSAPEIGRLRRLLDRALILLRSAGPSVAGKLAISMGDELIREIGEGIIHDLPH